MKKFYLFFGLALCMLTVGCSKDGGSGETEPIGPTGNDVVKITANIVNEGFAWSEGATIAVNGVESKAISEGVGTASGVFTVEKAKEAPFVVVAPFSAYETGNVLNVPDTQSYVADGLDAAAYVMYGYAEKLDEVAPEEPVLASRSAQAEVKTATVDMYNFCGVISLPLTVADGANMVIKSIDVTSDDTAAPLAGEWKADLTSGTFTSEKAYDTITLDCGEGVALGAEPVEFRFIVPIGTYGKGLIFTMETTDGHKDVYEYNEPLTIDAGGLALASREFQINEKKDAALNITIKEGSILWAAGDKVVVNGQLSDEVAAESVGISSAVFNVSNVAVPYKVLYPQDLYTTSGRLRLYNEQKLIANDCDREALAMVGYSATEDVTMHNVCGLIKIPVTNNYETDNLTITKIDIRSNDETPLCGKFNINYRNATLSLVSAVDELSLVPAEGTKGIYLPAGETVNLYAVVPEGRFPKGITVDVYTDSTNKLGIVCAPAGGLNVTRGEETAVETVEYAEVKIEKITTADELVALASAINRGRTDRFKNADGELVLGNDIDMTGVELPKMTGADNAGFADIFNGKGFAIKNLIMATSMFGTNNGTIENIVFEDCSFTGSVVETNMQTVDNIVLNTTKLTAPVVNQNAGTVSNIAMNAGCDVTFPAPEAATNFGFIVGGNAGTVTKCTNAIVYEKELASTPKASCNFGGIVGATTGLVSDCSFTGTFDMTVVAPAASQYHTFGGVVGYIKGAKDQVMVSGCTNSGKVKVTNNTKVMFSTGGVVGGTTSVAKATGDYGVVENCENTGSVGMRYVSGGSGSYPVCGGVCGYIEGYIKGCTNRGTVSMECNGSSSSAAWTAAKVAGVAGAVNMGASDCHNFGTLEFVAGYYAGGTEAARFSGVCSFACWAGVIASAGSWNTSVNSIFENCTNEVDMVYNPGSTTGTPQFAFGGVFGWLNGTAKNCVNKNSVTANTNTQYVNLGGISAGGNAHFEDCQNLGAIVLNANDVVVPAKWLARVGGITGWNAALASTAAATTPTAINAKMTNCSNSGAVTVNGGSGTSSNQSFVGGICGTGVNSKKTGSVTYEGCTNTGVITTPADYAKLSKGNISGDDNDL